MAFPNGPPSDMRVVRRLASMTMCRDTMRESRYVYADIKASLAAWTLNESDDDVEEWEMRVE